MFSTNHLLKKATLPVLILFGLILSSPGSAQDVTGLEGFTIFIDQGHSQQENQGIFGYSEAEKTLQVGLELQRLLMNRTDIDTAYVARTNDTMEVSLVQRTDLANSLEVDFYYSIHSDAAESPTAASTLFLYGGWRSDGATVEKSPEGGKDFGDILDTVLTAAMQTTSRGNFADRTFYEGNPENHNNQFPYLHVNRESFMPSLLSEASFHTNPYQNQRNMNADYKRLEARAAFWTVLQYLGVDRPAEGILTGEIMDIDTKKFANGVTVTVQDTSVTTDTYESLFHLYSSDPELLSNGFFYIDGLKPGPAQVILSGDEYFSDTLEVDILETELTYLDTVIRNNALPQIVFSQPAPGDTFTQGINPVILEFNKEMDTASVEEVLSVSPAWDYTLRWSDGKILEISTEGMDFETEYSVIIEEGPVEVSEHALEFDGDRDGEPGGIYILTFVTAPADTIPPQVVAVYPDTTLLSNEVVINITFDKLLHHESIDASLVSLETESQEHLPGQIEVYDVNQQSVLSFFPEEEPDYGTDYRVVILPGYADMAGNTATDTVIAEFRTGITEFHTVMPIHDFEDGSGSFWEPGQSGSTTGHIPDETYMEITTDFVNHLSESTQALRLNYGFYEENSGLIRFYTPDKSPVFDSTHTLQTYLFGDGNGGLFRMVVRDEAGELESSPWTKVDWLGWRQISWDLGGPDVISWVGGDGVIDGEAIFDSFQVAPDGGKSKSGFMVFDDLIISGKDVSTHTRDREPLPEGLVLHQNFPNPYRSMTLISFELPARATIDLDLYDLHGRKIENLYSGMLGAGEHRISYDGAGLPDGVYIYRLTYGNHVLFKKMLVMK